MQVLDDEETAAMVSQERNPTEPEVASSKRERKERKPPCTKNTGRSKSLCPKRLRSRSNTRASESKVPRLEPTGEGVTSDEEKSRLEVEEQEVCSELGSQKAAQTRQEQTVENSGSDSDYSLPDLEHQLESKAARNITAARLVGREAAGGEVRSSENESEDDLMHGVKSSLAFRPPKLKPPKNPRRKGRACGLCRQPGHTRTKCPLKEGIPKEKFFM